MAMVMCPLLAGLCGRATHGSCSWLGRFGLRASSPSSLRGSSRVLRLVPDADAESDDVELLSLRPTAAPSPSLFAAL